MRIELYERNVYGIVKIYIRDEKVEKLLNILTRRKTLQEEDIYALDALGHDVIVERLPDHAKRHK